MIKSIELKNIQSHENTKIELDKGINCIVGSSNNGKSAILRGLYWARYNRPLGIDTLASHWALNKKGELNDEMSVTIENENGIICRKRTKAENQYIVNGDILNVVKSDVPREVEQILKLSDTNIQRQLDAPFLLSETSGEVAKYFNHVVRLDIIDKVLTNAESSRRRTKSDIEATEKIIKEQEQKREKYDWLDSVEKLLRKWDTVKENNDELKSQSESLQSELESFAENKNRVEKYTNIVAQKDKLENISRLIEKTSEIEDLCGNLTNSLKTYKELVCRLEKLKKIIALKKLVAEVEELSSDNLNMAEKIHNTSNDLSYVQKTKIRDFSEQKRLIEKIEKWNGNSLQEKVDELSKSIYDYKIQKMHIENSAKDILCLQEQLPDICPVCGNPMKNGICKKEVEK